MKPGSPHKRILQDVWAPKLGTSAVGILEYPREVKSKSMQIYYGEVTYSHGKTINYVLTSPLLTTLNIRVG